MPASWCIISTGKLLLAWGRSIPTVLRPTSPTPAPLEPNEMRMVQRPNYFNPPSLSLSLSLTHTHTHTHTRTHKRARTHTHTHTHNVCSLALHVTGECEGQNQGRESASQACSTGPFETVSQWSVSIAFVLVCVRKRGAERKGGGRGERERETERERARERETDRQTGRETERENIMDPRMKI